jgi:hypothetical protein
MNNLPISFGDNVRVRSNELTESAGLAGLIGQVYGETTPSKTGVEVVGKITNDYALNVFFIELDESVWLIPELLEFIDHAPGTEFQIEGASQKFVRNTSGKWATVPVQSNNPWWKFW